MQVDGVPIPPYVAYWVWRYVRFWGTHLMNIRLRIVYYGTSSRHKLVRRRDDTSLPTNLNTKRRRRFDHAGSDTEEY